MVVISYGLFISSDTGLSSQIFEEGLTELKGTVVFYISLKHIIY